MSLASATAVPALLVPDAESSPTPQDPRLQSLYRASEERVYRRTNRLFQVLLVLQWAAALLFAVCVSPTAWDGPRQSIHPHLIAALALGGLLCLGPLLMIWQLPWSPMTRHVVAIAQVGFSSLLIHLTGGRIETHFHVFGSLAFLALYRDWRIMLTATVVVALDHLLRGIWFPESVYGVPYATPWRTLEHAGWVLFEAVVLIWSCRVSRREMWEICERQHQNEEILDLLENRVHDRTRDLESEVQERK